MKEEDTKPYVPLEVLREDRISFQSSGRNLSVKQASAEDFLSFISGALHVVNVSSWSIFMKWNALNVGLEAGTLTLSEEAGKYTLRLAEPKKTEVFSDDKRAS